MHAPAVQPSELEELHTVPHEPQLLTSLVVLMQVPLQHCWPAPQVTPQAPQLAAVVIETQAPEQHAEPPVHLAPAPHMQVPPTHISPGLQVGEQVAATQRPAVQVWPAGHAIPQLPQLAALDWVSTHAPPQQARPIVHAGMVPQWQRASAPHISPAAHAGEQPPATHVPEEHVWPAAHAFPHAPQLLVLVRASTQVVPQQVCPVGQVIAHAAGPVSRIVPLSRDPPGPVSPAPPPPVAQPGAQPASPSASTKKK